MKIINKKRKYYIYLFANRSGKEAFYLDEQKKCFYKIKTEAYDTRYGFLALFLAPLNLILVGEQDGNMWRNYFISCILGLIIGFIFLVIVNKSFFKRSFEKVTLTSTEIEKALHNLKEVFKIKCTLAVGWIILFLSTFVIYLDDRSYKSLVLISIVYMLLYPLLANIDFIRYRRIRNYLKQLL